MDNWSLFFSGLSSIATVGVLICTIIGFIYIRTQISIAKNKDIFFNFQREISQFMHEKQEKQNLCHIDFINTLNDCFKKKHLSSGTEIEYLIDKYCSIEIDLIVDKVLKKYSLETVNIYMINVSYYKWWMPKKYNDLKKIMGSNDFQKIFKYHDMYTYIIGKIIHPDHRSLPLMNESEKEEFRSSIVKNIKEEVIDYYETYNRLASTFDEFLVALAKDKKIS